MSITGPGSGLSTTHASTIRLEANASDPDGDLEGVSFYVNGEELYTWSGVIEFMGLPADGDVLTIDDGTGRNKPTIFEFDDNDVVIGGPTPLALASELNQLDDLVVSGNFTNPQSLNFKVEIDGTGTTDTFRWSIDGGISYIEERVEIIRGSAQSLADGLSVTFANATGHGLGDNWSFLGRAENVVVPISRNREGASLVARTLLTRNALSEAMDQQAIWACFHLGLPPRPRDKLYPGPSHGPYHYRSGQREWFQPGPYQTRTD